MDADTLDVRFPDGHIDTVRLIGLDAPEADTCPGKEATEWATNELPNRVTLVQDPTIPNRGKYDRLLRYVRIQPQKWTLKYADFGYQLLYAGHAEARTYNDPPHRLADLYAEADSDLGAKPSGCRDLDEDGIINRQDDEFTHIPRTNDNDRNYNYNYNDDDSDYDGFDYNYNPGDDIPFWPG